MAFPSDPASIFIDPAVMRNRPLRVGREVKGSDTRCPWCCRKVPMSDQSQRAPDEELPTKVCNRCRALYEHTYEEDIEPDRYEEGFHLLKGDCDETNDYHYVRVTHEHTEFFVRRLGPGPKSYNTPRSGDG